MMKKWMTYMLAFCLCFTCCAVNLAHADVSCSASTTLYGSSYEKRSNVELAADLLDGTTVGYGKTFSFNKAVGPRNKESGFVDAMNGRGAKVMGGGVSQVATTLYLAIRDQWEFEVSSFKAYGDKFVDNYVSDGEEAIITDYAAGTDFKFTNWYAGTITINAWTDDDNVYVSIEPGGSSSGSGGDGQLGSASTPLFGTQNKLNNIDLAAYSISGVTLNHNDEFSFNDLVGPRTKEAGFRSARNGRGVDVVGGGVSQVASTIYLAVQDLDCVRMGTVKTYGDKFVDGYVSDSRDAVVTDYNAGTDFSFVYTGYGTLTITLYEEDDRLVCEVYED